MGTVPSIEALPERFRGAPALPGGVLFRLSIGRAHRDVIVSGDDCSIQRVNGHAPDAHIATDPATWTEMYEGRLSGVEAFAQQRLSVRGSIEHSLWFEPLFERPHAGGLRYEMLNVQAGGLHHSVLAAGDDDAPPFVLLHGMGASKASWLTVVPTLARNHRVLAVDLPGYGASSKPIGRYDAPWFAERVFGLLDEMGYKRALVAGNSLGGRVAMEMAMARPNRIAAIACLSPASAFAKRPLLALVRLARPELGIAFPRLPRAQIRLFLRQLFAEPDRIAEVWYEAAVDDFLRSWRDYRFRLAFLATARRVYLDEPDGDNGFWNRICDLTVPALFVYGGRDPLISPRFGLRMQRSVPSAEVMIWDDCGHVPQLEHPERTTEAIRSFFTRARYVA